MKRWTVHPIGPLKGELRVPGDKSISHRALMFNALADGDARIRGLLSAGDVEATASAVRAMGATVQEGPREVIVRGGGLDLGEPTNVIDCGNSGTSMRLLSGIAAAQGHLTVLTGDASLRGRPMKRVVEPLRRMGAFVDGREGGLFAPLVIRGGELEMTHHDLPIASAQVKSCLLLAGLRCGVAVKEPRRSRDHTERMLQAMGVSLRKTEEDWMVLLPPGRLNPVDVDVPGDLSSAAFWLVAGAIVPGSEIYLHGVGINPTRAGIIDALQAMGADLQVYPTDHAGPEPTADLLIRNGPLVGTRIDGELALRCLDELPVLAVAASMAQGETVIADAEELRVKESDRIGRVVKGLLAMGVRVNERPDGMVIHGGRGLPNRGQVNAVGDHRIAMAFAVAGLASEQGAMVDGADAITSSYPRFREHLESLRV